MKAFAAAGLLFGALVLIKAAALYAFIGLLVGLIGFRLLRPASRTLRSITLEIGTLMLAFAIVVAPWMYRNWIQFGTLEISARGGIGLYHRALFNEVNAVEYRGLFYVWAPSAIRAAVGRALGFTPRDLERGGSLARLNAQLRSAENLAAREAGRPEDATSIMAEGLAELAKARAAFKAAGLEHEHASLAADNLLKERAIRKMIDNPTGAFAVTLATSWRGAILLLPVFVWVSLNSLRRRDDLLLAFCLAAFGMTLFHALVTFFEPRYGSTMTPVALLSAVVLAFDSLRSWQQRRSERTSFYSI